MSGFDIFIKKPVLSLVITLLILVAGLRSFGLLQVRQYPYLETTVITVVTAYPGADPETIAGFITVPLEKSIAQVDGIDYMTSKSIAGTSTITVNLRLNYPSDKALTEITNQVNSMGNQLPAQSLKPVLTVSIGDTLNAMYLGFSSEILKGNQITDYLNRVVVPQLQAVSGVQNALLLGDRQFALRVWVNPQKLAAYGLTSAEVAKALSINDVISAPGRTDGGMVMYSMVTNTDMHTLDEFQNMVVKTTKDTLVRLKDVASVTLGAQSYDTSVKFDGRDAIYIGISPAPTANVLDVVDDVKKAFQGIQNQLPQGLDGKIVYDSTKFIHAAVNDVQSTLLEAILIVAIVVFLFLGQVKAVLIPLVTIPLCLIGTLFFMLFMGYTLNLLTLLAFVLAIGLVVDDAIIVVENVQRHMEEGMSVLDSSIKAANELASPIIAISLVLVAVYLPIGFMGGLTGSLFNEFAFTLAGAVGISAIFALVLSPMMCSKWLSMSDFGVFKEKLDHLFHRLQNKYKIILESILFDFKSMGIFIGFVVMGLGLFAHVSKTELAPQEDQGVIISLLTGSPNSTLYQTNLYANEAHRLISKFPETDHMFQINGSLGLNISLTGAVLTPWKSRTRNADTLQPLIQNDVNAITGTKGAVFQRPPLPGAGGGLPMQFVICSVDSFEIMNKYVDAIVGEAMQSRHFMFVDPDLKLDLGQAKLVINRDKVSQMGLSMQDIASSLSAALSGGYINYFTFYDRAYQVIQQVLTPSRLNVSDILSYYLKVPSGAMVPISNVMDVNYKVTAESINRFQQLNSITISGILAPGVTMGQALDTMRTITKKVVPDNYIINYGGQARQFMMESSSFAITFMLSLILIYLCLAALFNSFKDPLVVLITVPLSIFGSMFFIALGIKGASLNIYTEVGLVTLLGLISKHGILIVSFAQDLREHENASIKDAIIKSALIRLRPILMTTAAMVFGSIPLITATGAGAASRYNIGLVIVAGLSIGTLFTLFVLPSIYIWIHEHFTWKNTKGLFKKTTNDIAI
jgi:multidrug efflux pump